MRRVKDAVVGGFRFCIVDGLRFEEFENDPASLNEYILKLCSLIGNPTDTDQQNGTIVWPVKPVAGLTGENSTYSQHHDSAELHTDTQYFSTPEEVVSLWCLHPDAEGNGESLCADGRMIIEELKTLQKEETTETLAQPIFPFRVPAVFTKTGADDSVEVFVGPILSEKPLIRYRRQTIDNARSFDTHQLSAATIEALDVLDNILLTRKVAFQFLLKRGQVLFLNNHEILHGRTAFNDMERHLLRVRLNLEND